LVFPNPLNTMKFVVSSPDSLLFDRSEFSRDRSRTEQVAVSVLALLAVGMQVGVFVMIHKMIGAGLI